MLKQGIRNYFRNLKHFFTPMGAMFLGLVLGASVFLPVLSSAFHQLIAGVNALSEQFNVDFNHLFKSLFDSISKLDWSKPGAALHTMFSSGWLKTTVGKSLEALLGVDYKAFVGQIGKLLDVFCGKVGKGLVGLAVLFVLGVIGGYYLTAYLVRRNVTGRTWWKFLLTYLVDFVVNVGLIALGVWLTLLWKYSAIIFVFVAIIISALVSLTNAYVMQGHKKISLKKVISIKNAMQYVLSVLIVWLINLALCIIVKIATSSLVAAVVAIALVEIVLPVNKLNAEEYVKSMVDCAADSLQPSEIDQTTATE